MNNAGLFPTKYYVTKNNIESAFQTNVLSHILLTYTLLPHFNKNGGKVINLSSHFHEFSDYTSENLKSLINLEKSSNSFKSYEKLYYSNVIKCNTLYGNTKVGNIFFTQILAEYLEKFYPHIKTVSLHPGAVFTDFTSNSMSSNFFIRIFYYIVTPIIYLFFRSPIAGAQTQLHLTYMDLKELVNGAYYENCRNNTKSTSNVAKNKDIRDLFIDYCHLMLKKNYHTDNKDIQSLFSNSYRLIVQVKNILDKHEFLN